MFLTIFTPSYNRRDRLPALYQSLMRQAATDFEWIIVDDGSTDGTWDYLKSIVHQPRKFSMKILHQENGGKHRGINRALTEAKGTYFFIVDSDDYLTDDAVEKIHSWCKALEADPKSKKEKIGGVVGLRIYPDGKVIGEAGDGCPVIDATNFERSKFHLNGDKAEVVRTDVMREFPFPEFPGETFLSEGVVWKRMAAAGYKLRYYNQGIYIGEYLPGGLSDSVQKNRLKSFSGYTLEIRENVHYPQISWKKKAAYITDWTKIARKKGLKSRQCVEALNLSWMKFYLSNGIVRFYRFVRYFLLPSSINNRK